MGGKLEHKKPLTVKKEVLRDLEIQARKWDARRKVFTIVLLAAIATILPGFSTFIVVALLAMIYYELKGL